MMVEKKGLFAVITGDLVSSSELKYEERVSFLSYLRNSFDLIQEQLQLQGDIFLPFEVFRGDSFQTVINRPEHALLASILMLLKLSSYNAKSKEPAARISVGIGTVDYVPESGSVGEADGMAFRLSGKALDNMKEKGQYLLVTTQDPALNLMFESQCAFFDLVAARWTDVQKEILLERLSGSTQEEIASKRGKSQSSVSQSLNAAGFDAVKKFLDNYESLFEHPDIFLKSER